MNFKGLWESTSTSFTSRLISLGSTIIQNSPKNACLIFVKKHPGANIDRVRWEKKGMAKGNRLWVIGYRLGRSHNP
jgi:hypothetical protein